MRRITSVKAMTVAALTLGAMIASGCQSNNNSRTARTPNAEQQETQPTRARVTGTRYSYSPAIDGSMTAVGLPFPTGDEATSALLLHQVMPREARRGADFPVEYHVTNVTNGTLQNVALMLESQSNLLVSDATPAPMRGTDGMTWAIGDLGPGQTEIVYLTASADESGTAGSCVSVSYNNSLCAVMDIVDPALTVAKDVTPRVLRCDPISITYTVCNTGTGVASGVVVSDTLPRGVTVNGSNSVNIEMGDLASGECRDVTVVAEASSTGEFCSPAMARSSDGLTAESGEPCTIVVQPELAIECESRERQYFNRPARFAYTVSNNGDGVSANTVVTANVPAGVSVLETSRNGTASGSSVNWALGSLAPGESRTVWLELTTPSNGNVSVSAAASGDCADPATTRCSTIFEGIPAILLEVVDIVDPVEIGTTTTYRIIVTNQGSAPDTQIVIDCVLPDEQEFVAASGATDFRRNGQNITFRPVQSLAPGAQAIWEVTVRATGEGDVRFSLEMTSALKTRPIRETESTTQYR